MKFLKCVCFFLNFHMSFKQVTDEFITMLDVYLLYCAAASRCCFVL